MKVLRINLNGTMDEIDINNPTRKNLISKLKKISQSNSKGDIELKELYRWSVDSNIELLCYGYYDGSHGFENKHELPPNGISNFLDDYNSSSKLLFGDIFLSLFNNKDKKIIDCCVSDYGAYYEQLFEGFDECNTSDDDEEECEEEEINTDDEDFIDDKEELSDDEDDSDFNSDEQLDVDDNDYTSEESDYDDECEGETDEEQ